MKPIIRLGRLIYAALLGPALGFLVGRYPQSHRRLTQPIIEGPYRGQLVDYIQDAISRLERQELTTEEFIWGINARMCDSVANDRELKSWLSKTTEPTQNLDITLARCVGYAPGKRWYLKLHFMAEGNVHDLHAHQNVISTQVVAQGKLHVQEFDLLGSLYDDSLRLKLRRDEIVSPINGFISTDDECNVHGFYPAGGSAVRFQFYLRGHGSLATQLFPRRGRLYVHPMWETLAGDIVLAKSGRLGRSGES
jgi:hypothetical protein